MSTYEPGQPYVAAHGSRSRPTGERDETSARAHALWNKLAASGGTGAVNLHGSGGARRTNESQAPARVPSLHAWPNMSTLELAALPTAVACGRLHTRQLLWEWKLDVLADDAETLVSELLTNAVKTSRSLREPSFVALRLFANRHQVVIEVWDQNPRDPEPHVADFEAEHGRGFMVIDALSSRWGYRRVSTNLKVVWCELVTEQP